ncbi:hypothetical protein JCM10207_007445 [Rhodosporidiobolus poonsookiae]
MATLFFPGLGTRLRVLAVFPTLVNSSLCFWSAKNDASLFLVGTHTKKHPHGLVWVRCFAGEVMEMLGVGIEEVMAMSSFKSIKSTFGGVPLFHFSAMDGVALKGLERVISVTIGGSPSSSSKASARAGIEAAANASGNGQAVLSLIVGAQDGRPGRLDEDKTLPVVHFRTYGVKFMRSGLPQPRVELEPHGPHFTFSLRRIQLPASETWRTVMEEGNKNIDIDEMGDKVGRVHVDHQDLDKLQSRKFKGLKR